MQFFPDMAPSSWKIWLRRSKRSYVAPVNPEKPAHTKGVVTRSATTETGAEQATLTFSNLFTAVDIMGVPEAAIYVYNLW